MLARIARIGLAAELIGVIALGLYLLMFQREQPFSVFFDSMGAGGDDAYLVTFLAASLSGLFLFYGFEACGDVAEEVADPTRRIPRAMILTILIGGVSGLISYAGYVLAAPEPAGDRRRQGRRPDPLDPRGHAGHRGSKVFLVIAVTAFISCVLSLQAAGSRLLYAFGPRPDAAGEPLALAHVRQARGADQCAARRLRRPDPDLPVRVLAARHPGPGDRVRRAAASTSPSRRSCWPRCGSGSRAGARPGCGTSGAGACWSTSWRWPTASSRSYLLDPAGGHRRLPGPLDRRHRASPSSPGAGLLYLFIARPDRHSDGRPRGRRHRGRRAAARDPARRRGRERTCPRG